jgi:hypothetical protein
VKINFVLQTLHQFACFVSSKLPAIDPTRRLFGAESVRATDFSGYISKYSLWTILCAKRICAPALAFLCASSVCDPSLVGEFVRCREPLLGSFKFLANLARRYYSPASQFLPEWPVLLKLLSTLCRMRIRITRHRTPTSKSSPRFLRMVFSSKEQKSCQR